MRTKQGRVSRMLLIVGLAGALVAAQQVCVASELEPIEVGQPKSIEVFPPAVQLNGVREQMQLVVSGLYTDGSVQDLTRVAEISSTNAAIVEAEGTVLHPRGDGTADVVVRVAGLESSISVSVRGQTKSQPVSFQYGTLPALSKQGCNSGACHGSPSGKGGFRLSLRAFDAELDKLTLIHEDYGRRSNPLNPDESLLLLKPMMRVPHGGGLKLRPTDPAYREIRDWIAEGCQVDREGSPRCTKLEVYPPTGRLLKRPAHTQQLCVLAHFSDGSIRDVTQLAVYSSSDDEVASVDERGFVVGKDRGEAAIIVRYLEFIESRFITFVRDIEGFAWTNPSTNNYVDELVDAKLKQLQFLPSDACTDAEFIRRVSLDTVGLLPTVEQVDAFLNDSSPNKRAKLVDRLLDQPEFAKFWALKWGDVLRMTSKQVGGDGVYKYHRWVERAIADNMPYDEFARHLLTASGSTLTNPPANFYRTATDTNDCVESISQVFLGARLQCAKCHNHPFERWTQDNYYGMAAFFNRVQRKKTPRADELVVWVDHTGEVTQPRTGQQMKPWLPMQGDVENPEVDDRRTLFADWLTQPDNPFFGKIEVNRIWSQLLGKGIVDPPDDFRDSNPPSNAALLDALAEDFAEHGFDRKHVIRAILNSRTYQASFEPNEFNRDDTKYFSHYQPRLLSAEQLLDAICHVTAVPETFASLPPGTKATQLPAPDLVKHEFLKIFGQPERQTVCACERTSESNLGMAIQFFNGPLIYNKLRDGKNRFRNLIDLENSNEQIISQLHMAAVCRTPTEKELAASLSHIVTKDEQSAARNKEIEVELAELEKQLPDLRKQLEQTKQTLSKSLLEAKLQTVPESIRADVQTAVAAEEKSRSEVQKYLFEKLGSMVTLSDKELTEALDKEDTKQAVVAAEKKVADLKKERRTPAERRIEALEDICWALLNTNEFLFQH